MDSDEEASVFDFRADNQKRRNAKSARLTRDELDTTAKGGDNEKTMRNKALAVITSLTLALSYVPTAAAVTFEISGNGSDSNNTGTLNVTTTRTVVQSNDAHINNDIDVDSNTGDNDVEDNTGGEVNVETGDATTKVEVTNAVNSNSATVDCCAQNDMNVLISGNGTDSDNTVDLKQDNTTELFQDNHAYVRNDVDVDSETGDNDVEDNTGGDVDVETGDADTTITLSTAANTNAATVGGGNGEGGEVDVRIVGNGSHSDNDVNLELLKDIVVVQDNDAHVRNDADVDANTGDNDVEDNTGGETSLDTGDATTEVTVENMVNFNWADVDCGCVLDVFAKIADNGTDSENDIEATLEDTQEVFQGGEKGSGNEADLDNDVDIDAETGDNELEDSTAEGDGDPALETGDADSTVLVENSGNVNVVGEDAPEMPEMVFQFNFALTLEQLADLLGLEL